MPAGFVQEMSLLCNDCAKQRETVWDYSSINDLSFQNGRMGWEMGFEPTTFGATGLQSQFVMFVFNQMQPDAMRQIG